MMERKSSPTIKEIAIVKILVKSRTEMTPVPHDPSEFEKLKHQLAHIPFQPWCTSCVKRKAQAEPHKRTDRIIEDSELAITQCDCPMLKDVTGSSGLVCENIRVRHVHSCRNEKPNRHVRNNVGSEKC